MLDRRHFLSSLAGLGALAAFKTDALAEGVPDAHVAEQVSVDPVLDFPATRGAPAETGRLTRARRSGEGDVLETRSPPPDPSRLAYEIEPPAPNIVCTFVDFSVPVLTAGLPVSSTTIRSVPLAPPSTVSVEPIPSVLPLKFVNWLVVGHCPASLPT